MTPWDDKFFAGEVRDPETIRLLKVLISNSVGRLSDRAACRVLKMDLAELVVMRTDFLQRGINACADGRLPEVEDVGPEGLSAHEP
ncbi:MAG: hypothetical protein K8J09_04730 [Planctomycetes bacterium]|nr:hypothetical protein [Planctomycetota bacterium]